MKIIGNCVMSSFSHLSGGLWGKTESFLLKLPGRASNHNVKNDKRRRKVPFQCSYWVLPPFESCLFRFPSRLHMGVIFFIYWKILLYWITKNWKGVVRDSSSTGESEPYWKNKTTSITVSLTRNWRCVCWFIAFHLHFCRIYCFQPK